MSSRIFICAALGTLMLGGCRDREITTYRAPKDAPPTATPGQAAATDSAQVLPPDHPPIGGAAAGPDQATMANTAVPTAGGSGLRWTAPADWAPKTGSSMRKGSYAVKTAAGEADLGITAFPGATGGLEANLNRWRGQVGLPPAAPADVVAAVEKFESNGLSFLVVDYANNGTRLVGAIVPYEGNSWFFKLMGPDAVVAAQKATFVEFLHTVKSP